MNQDEKNLIKIAVNNLATLPSILSLYFLSLAGVGFYLFSRSYGGNIDLLIGFLLMVLFVGGASVYYVGSLIKENSALKVENKELLKRVDELENKIDRLIEALPDKYKKYVIL
jgi:ABC-type siderophore export system fused ATPase/permease subunit